MLDGHDYKHIIMNDSDIMIIISNLTAGKSKAVKPGIWTSHINISIDPFSII